MKKYIVLLILTIISILILPGVVLAAATGNGVIEGDLLNKTPGSTSSLANIEITLRTYQNNKVIGETKAKTDAKGHFVFSNLPTGDSYSYELTATYQDTDYSSDRITFKSGEAKATATLSVYDSTTSNKAIKIVTAHTVISPGEKGGLRVMEYYQFVNEGDRSFVGTADDKRTLRFSLPGGATDLQYDLDLMSCCVAQSEEGLADTMGIPPGTREEAYAYTINAKSGSFDYANKVIYPMDNYDLLVFSGIQVSSEQLSTVGPVSIDGKNYERYAGKDLEPGDVIGASLSNIPRAAGKLTGTLLWVTVVLFILVGGFGSIYLVKRRKPQPVLYAGNPTKGKQRLLHELADLDDSFENGQITESAYRKLRATKKAQLLKMIQKTGGKI